MYDLVIHGGRVLDPGQGIDRPLDVAFADGKVAELAAGLPRDNARQLIDATDRVVTPGLIDLHSHVYWGGTSLGVDADCLATRSGTTTFIDAGSAGAGNFLGFRRHVIERSRARILAYLNISFAGIFGFSQNVMVGECGDLRLCDPAEAVRAAREHLDLVVGVKVRAGRIAGGGTGVAPLDLARQAAEELQLPVMTHMDMPPPTHEEVMPRLRKGDILTHCFRPFPNAPVTHGHDIRAEVKAARERGVIFDIGHGKGSFGFQTARAMLAEGFKPDVISSDVHILCIDGPAYDLLVTMSKFLCLGLPLADVIRAATAAPAAAINRPELGTLRPGAPGDAALLECRQGRFDYVDVQGETMTGDQRLFCDGIVMGGQWWPNEAAGQA